MRVQAEFAACPRIQSGYTRIFPVIWFEWIAKAPAMPCIGISENLPNGDRLPIGGVKNKFRRQDAAFNRIAEHGYRRVFVPTVRLCVSFACGNDERVPLNLCFRFNARSLGCFDSRELSAFALVKVLNMACIEERSG